MYTVNTVTKHAEEDNFNEGCLPETSFLVEFDLNVKKPTVKELIEELKIYLGDYYEIDPCEDEPSRIDFQRTENEYGEEPSKSELEAWKKGRKRLWQVGYSCYVERIGTCDVKKELETA